VKTSSGEKHRLSFVVLFVYDKNPLTLFGGEAEREVELLLIRAIGNTHKRKAKDVG